MQNFQYHIRDWVLFPVASQEKNSFRITFWGILWFFNRKMFKKVQQIISTGICKKIQTCSPQFYLSPTQVNFSIFEECIFYRKPPGHCFSFRNIYFLTISCLISEELLLSLLSSFFTMFNQALKIILVRYWNHCVSWLVGLFSHKPWNRKNVIAKLNLWKYASGRKPHEFLMYLVSLHIVMTNKLEKKFLYWLLLASVNIFMHEVIKQTCSWEDWYILAIKLIRDG